MRLFYLPCLSIQVGNLFISTQDQGWWKTEVGDYFIRQSALELCRNISQTFLVDGAFVVKRKQSFTYPAVPATSTSFFCLHMSISVLCPRPDQSSCMWVGVSVLLVIISICVFQKVERSPHRSQSIHLRVCVRVCACVCVCVCFHA